MSLMKVLVQTGCWLLLIFGSPQAVADEEASRALINAYMQAVRSDDEGRIKSTWLALNNSEEAKAYMKANMPELDYLFGIRRLYMELQEFQSNRPELFGGENRTESFRQTVDTLQKDLSPQAIVNVDKFSVSDPDRNVRRTNRDIVMDSQGPKIDNRTIALGNPNQNRIDNDEFVRNRADRMFDSKFQEVPGELVPRGSTFPKTRLETLSDVLINEAATRVVFSNNSQQEQSVDIYVNGALVGKNVVVNERGRRFEVYFSGGVNRLRVVGHPSDDSALSLNVSLESAGYIKDQDNWTVKPGQDRQWSVEVRL